MSRKTRDRTGKEIIMMVEERAIKGQKALLAYFYISITSINGAFSLQ